MSFVWEAKGLQLGFGGETLFPSLDLRFSSQEKICVIGRSGSGKSTLLRTITGFVKPSKGEILMETQEGKPSFYLVSQFAEQQFSCQSVLEELCFSPYLDSLSQEEKRERAHSILELVELDLDRFQERSPWSLSGGEQKRLSLACALMLEPSCLLLDEFSSGLDAPTLSCLMSKLSEWCQHKKIGWLWVSHNFMSSVRWCERFLVIGQGEIVFDGDWNDLLKNYSQWTEWDFGDELFYRWQNKVGGSFVDLMSWRESLG